MLAENIPLGGFQSFGLLRIKQFMAENRSPDVQQQDGVTVVSLGPEYESLHEQNLEDVQEDLLVISDAADPPLVVLDLSHTQFFSSSFIEILFRIWNRLNAREGGKFGISGLTVYCKEILKVAHLDELWNIFNTKEEAVSALSNG